MGQQHSKQKNANHKKKKSLKRSEKTSTKKTQLTSSSSSGLAENQSERESLSAWIREGVDVREVYNIHQIIGHGHLGVITIVTRKKKKNGFSQHHRNLSSNSISSGSPIMSHHRTISGKSLYNLTGLSSFDSSGDDEPSQSLRPRFDSDGSLRRDRMYACKSLSTARMQAGQVDELLNEVRIMRELDHPHILHLFEVYYVKRRMWVITELCTGGDLFRRIDTNTELHVCSVMEQISRAVAYMHRRGVCHRDIKLENILYEHDGSDAGIKLIDFGLSQKFTRGTRMLRAVGTVYSVAPELVLGQGYTEMSDIWSVGCVAFVLLSAGKFPFLTDQEAILDEEQKKRLLNADYTFGKEWDERQVSSEGREYTRCCLQKEPTSRWTARDMLNFVRDRWEPALEEEGGDEPDKSSEESTECPSESSGRENSDVPKTPPSTRRLLARRKLGSGTLKGMKDFALYGQLKKRVLMIMAHTMDKSSLSELSDLFIAMDFEGTGTISIEEMRAAIQQMYDEKNYTEFTEEDIDNMFKGIDQDRSGQIHYAEFLAAVIESQGLITMELLGEAFDRIDTHGKGFISREDLQELLGRDYDEDLVTKMIEEADFKENGQVDYDEFLNLMFEDPANAMEVISMGDVFNSIRSTGSDVKSSWKES